MFANTQMMGTVMGFPDVSLAPMGPVPVPHQHIAMGPMGVPAAYNVLFMCAAAHNIATGVASGIVMGPSKHVTAAFTVRVGGIPATRLTSVSLQNSTKCPRVRLVPSQVNVMLLAP